MTFLLVLWTLLALGSLVGSAATGLKGWATFWAILLGIQLYVLIGVLT